MIDADTADVAEVVETVPEVVDVGVDGDALVFVLELLVVGGLFAVMFAVIV